MQNMTASEVLHRQRAAYKHYVQEAESKLLQPIMEALMPYIEQEARKDLEPLIERLFHRIKNPGDFNYVICRLFWLLYTNSPNFGYHEMSRWRAAITDAADEIYAVVFRPREDIKARINGAVFTADPVHGRTPFTGEGT